MPKPPSQAVLLKNICELHEKIDELMKKVEGHKEALNVIQRTLTTQKPFPQASMPIRHAEPIQPTKPEEQPLTFGKHRGKRPIDLVGTRDEQYIVWMFENIPNSPISQELYDSVKNKTNSKPRKPDYAPPNNFNDDFDDDDIPF